MLKISQDVKLDFEDVLIVPQRSSLNSRSEVDIVREFSFPHAKRTISGLGVIAANMDTTGTFAMAKELSKKNMFTALHKFYTVDRLIEFFNENSIIWDKVWYTVGVQDNDFNKLKLVQKEFGDGFPYLINIDTPNGYMESFLDVVKKYRQEFPESVIMAGTVVTPNITEEIINAGADVARVGIGGGSVCLTRVQAAIGYPQLSAISECSFAAHGNPGGHVCGDGGVKCVGDICRALSAGADWVMSGSLFAGFDECEGDWEYEENYCGSMPLLKDILTQNKVKKYLKFYGMSSREAQEKHYGGTREWRASEGKCTKVPYKGGVAELLREIEGGIRSCCTYIGAKRVKDMSKCAQFIRVNRTHNDFYGK